MEFLVALFYRVISGWQNASGYAKDEKKRVMLTTVMGMFGGILFIAALSWNLPLGFTVITCFFFIVSIVAAVGVDDSFSDAYKTWLPGDIHLHETITTGAMMLALCTGGKNILMVALSVYPGLMLHKALINSAFGKPWNWHATDDPTGKTFGIPFLGIKVRRSSHQFRMVAAIASIVLAVLAWRFGWGIWLAPLRISI